LQPKVAVATMVTGMMVASIVTVFFFDGRSSGPVLLAGFVARVS